MRCAYSNGCVLCVIGPPWGEVENLPPANDPEYSGPGGWKERYIDRYRVIFDPKEHWFELALVPFVFYATFY